MSSGGANGPTYPGVLPAFGQDVNNMRNFAYSLGGMQAPQGAFASSPGMMNAANVGNNYFGAGNPGAQGIGQLSQILSGANLSPSSNPYLQDTIKTMQQAFGQTLGQGEDSLNAQFQMAGQTGADSGARNNAMSQFGRGAMSDFSNALGGQLFGQYNQGQNQITQALGLMDQPLGAAGMASSLGQAPGQEAVAGQQYGLNLQSLPFQYMMQLMQNAPISNPQYGPEQTPWYDYLLGGLGQGVGPGLAAAFA